MNSIFSVTNNQSFLSEESYLIIRDATHNTTLKLISENFHKSSFVRRPKQPLPKTSGLAQNFFMKRSKPEKAKKSVYAEKGSRGESAVIVFEVESGVVNTLIRKLVKSLLTNDQAKTHDSRFEFTKTSLDELEKYLLVSSFSFVVTKSETTSDNIKKLNKFVFHVLFVVIEMTIQSFLKTSAGRSDKKSPTRDYPVKTLRWLKQVRTVRGEQQAERASGNRFLSGRDE